MWISSRPAAPRHRIEQFLERYRDVTFSHAAAVLPLLDGDEPTRVDIVVHDIALTASFRDLMRVRARPRPAPEASPHLLEDLRALSAVLDAARDQTLALWSVTLSSGRTYLIYELLDDGAIAGCVETMDQIQRMIVPADQIRAFVARYAASAFERSDEVLALMRRCDPAEVQITARELPWAALFANEHLFPGPVAELRSKLVGVREQPIRIWSLSLESGDLYFVVELVDEQRVAGVMTGVDQLRKRT